MFIHDDGRRVCQTADHQNRTAQVNLDGIDFCGECGNDAYRAKFKLPPRRPVLALVRVPELTSV